MSAVSPKIDLSIDPLYTVGVLTTFLCDQFAKKGFTDAVLGLSGGVDSAVGAALLANALGPEHVTGLIMPAAQSDPQSEKDALAVAAAFGIGAMSQPIGDIIAAFFAGEKKPDRVRIGNVAARVRMMRLYDWSHEYKGLVVGTSNKTELLLGYGTLFGDLACALNPIGDLYKTQVWQLADWLGVPEQVVTKPPSADLWPGQTDEGELGFTYADVDRLLLLMIDRDYGFDELADAGFAADFTRRVYDRVIRSQYKRSSPTIAKLGLRTVGIDFHLAREWGR